MFPNDPSQSSSSQEAESWNPKNQSQLPAQQSEQKQYQESDHDLHYRTIRADAPPSRANPPLYHKHFIRTWSEVPPEPNSQSGTEEHRELKRAENIPESPVFDAKMVQDFKREIEIRRGARMACGYYVMNTAQGSLGIYPLMSVEGNPCSGSSAIPSKQMEQGKGKGMGNEEAEPPSQPKDERRDRRLSLRVRLR